MKSNSSTQNGTVQDGTEEKEEKIFTIAEVQKLLRRDLHTALLCLQSVHDDQDALLALATTLHGKYLNHRQKMAIESEIDEFRSKGHPDL